MLKDFANIFKSKSFLSAALIASAALSLSFSAAAQQTAPTTNSGNTTNTMPAQGSAAASPAAMPANPSPNLPVQAPPSAQTPPSVNASMVLPPPPTPAALANPALANDPNQLASQAEEAAMQAQAQQEMDKAKKEQEHNLKSYDRAAAGLLPLSPDQVRDFMHKLEQTQDASQSPFAGQPKGQVRIATLSLDPGVDPPQVNLAAGYVTTINMVDATGEPWPILDVGVGGNFEVSPTQAGSHVVRVMPLTRVGAGDLSVLLKDLPTPIIFRLQAGGSNVDLRYDARIAKLGPGAKAPLIQRPRIEAGDENIMMLLENAPPNSAKRMKVTGLDARTKAWMMDSHVFVRTPLTLLSPAWDASVSSADGMTVYEIGDAPVLLMSDNGAMVRAQLIRDDDHDK